MFLQQNKEMKHIVLLVEKLVMIVEKLLVKQR